MNNREAVNWLINISADIGKAEHSDLWHYEQALTEIKDMLESAQPVATDTNVGSSSEIPNTSDCISRQAAIDALKAQLSQEGTTKGTTSDTISRQAAIDALNEYFARIGKLKRRGLTEGEKAISLDTVGAIKTLPPAQPEERTEKRTETHACDLISRSEAIDALKHNQDVYSHNFHDDPIDKYTTAIIATDIDTLVNLPSAQPEPQEGHWIWVAGDLECSKCHTRYPDLYPDYDNSVACPHCGCKMEVEHDSDLHAE